MAIRTLQLDVDIPATGNVRLYGRLTVPPEPLGIVAFAHGSGSSHLSPRNVEVAERLQQHRIATLLFDLLTRHEERDYDSRFNIPLLTERLLAATAWLQQRSETRTLKIGYFGASTGAAAALRAAARLGGQISAVVCRGGRPDLAGRDPLEKVVSPTLLVVGGNDDTVIALNRQSLAVMSCTRELVVIAGATHLFEEPGALEQVAEHAIDWFERWFAT
jgi:pimeloyl-ACP methyl ester carboxylesterase